MKNKPVVLGINRTQYGSMALLEGEKALCCVQKERITHKKHHWGKLGDIPLYKNYSPNLSMPIDLLVEGYSIQVGIEDFESRDDRRALSSVRNIFFRIGVVV